MAKLLSRVPKRAQTGVATMVRTVLPAALPRRGAYAACACGRHARERFPEAAALLLDAAFDILAFTASPWPTGSRSGRTTRRGG